MKISPIDIRQKEFEKKFRGYDVDEVNAFLNTLSMEWQHLMEENRELKLRFENAEREVHKLREVETTLFKTLKTAEDTSNNILEQANKQAELILKQAKMDADNALAEAKANAKSLLEEAENESRMIVKNAQEDLKAINSEHRELEIKKDNILQELRNIANDLNDRIERYKSRSKIELFNTFDEKTKPILKKEGSPSRPLEIPFDGETKSVSEKVEASDKETEVGSDSSKPSFSGSFFDNL